MPTRTRMLRRMLVWRTITTSSSAALLAGAQVNPLVSRLNTLFANSLFRLFDISDRIDMNAYFCCHSASIQFADDNPRGGRNVCWDNPHPDLTVDRVSKLVFRICQHLAPLESHRRKMIASRTFH